ncbi:hypothetical protein R6Q57_013080 [Mikania cordata]
METPLPSRRITRSQASIFSVKNNNNDTTTIPTVSKLNEESKNGVLKSRNKERERSALIDVTNGSPIIGLAMGTLKTPSTRRSKKKMMVSNSESKNTMTPGSGESLLRGQVKTLLQKVEEQGVISKFCFKQFVNSLTPANTPQVHNFSTSSNNGLNPFTVSPVAENFNFNQMLNDVVSAPNQEDQGENIEKNVIMRSLLMDFSERSCESDSSDCNSDLTCQDSNASMWSVQVNASTSDEHKEDEDHEDKVVDELCVGMSKISVNNAVKFTGKHTRFVYNSDGELERILS